MGRGAENSSYAAAGDLPRSGSPTQASHLYTDEPASYEAFTANNLNVIRLDETWQVEKMVGILLGEGYTQISIDFETTNKHGGKIADDYTPFDGRIRLVQIGVEHPKPTQYVIDAYGADIRVLDKLLSEPSIEKLIHYAPFEQAWSIVHIGTPINNVYDTCAAFQSIQKELGRWKDDKGQAAVDEVLPGWIKHPNSLAVVTKHVHGFPLPKDEQGSDWSEDDLTDAQVEYAAMDVAVLPAVARAAKALADDLKISSRISWRCNKSREEAIEAIPPEMIITADDTTHITQAMNNATSVAELQAAGFEAKRLSVAAVNRNSLEQLYKARFAELKV